MFQKLVNHNPDLQRLVEKGYAVAFDSTNHLIVRDIPYLGPGGELMKGAIVAKLEFIDQEQVKQTDHQIYFAGSVPHGLNGEPIPNLGGGPTSIQLSESCSDIIVERSFSNKPTKTGAFADFFDKIESYTTIISGPAIEAHGVSPFTFRAVKEMVPDSIFKFHDTLTSRAEIGDLVSKLEDDIIAIIGLGGTGSYILDFLVKSRVREIRGFDGDPYHVHNAFRMPGGTAEEEFGRKKADVLSERYNNFRTGLKLDAKFIDETCSEDFAGVTFAFICVDKGSSRSIIIDLLISMGIPFIDVGMGLRKNSSALKGSARLTYFSHENANRMRDCRLVDLLSDTPDDIYRSNIQISELNALNASLAIIKYKQLRGFYREELSSNHIVFNIDELKTYGELI